MPEIIYADILFDYPKESSEHFTSVQQTRFHIQRIIDHQQRCWITQNPSPVPKPKTLLFADWSAPQWSERKTLDVIACLSQILEDGFTLYVWQDGDLEPLTQDTLFFLRSHAYRRKITPVPKQQIIDAALQQLTSVGPDQVHVVDNYWMNYFLEGGGWEAPEIYRVRYSDLPESSEALKLVLQHLKHHTPEVSTYHVDKLPIKETIDNKIDEYFPFPTVVRIINKHQYLKMVNNAAWQWSLDFTHITLNGIEVDIGQIIELDIKLIIICPANKYLWQSPSKLEALSISFDRDLMSESLYGVTSDLSKLKVLQVIGLPRYHCPKEFFSKFLKHAQNLQSFIWTGVAVPELTERLVFPNLKYVALPPDISQASIVHLLSHSHQLESLNSIPLTPETIEQLDTSELKELVYHDWQDDSIILKRVDLALLLRRAPKLINLSIDVRSRIIGNVRWTETISLPNLKKISIRKGLSIDGLCTLLVHSKQLEYVDIATKFESAPTDEAYNLEYQFESLVSDDYDNETLAHLLSNNPHLTSLALPPFSAQNLKIILIHCHKLKYLDLSLADDDPIAFTLQSGFPSLSTLKQLKLSNVQHDDFCCIVSEAHDLSDLTLTNCMIRGNVQKLREFTKLINVTLEEDCRIDKENLAKLMLNAQNISLIGALFVTHICSIPLPKLKKIRMGDTTQYSNSQLQDLLSHIPIDADIDAFFLDSRFNDAQQALKETLEERGAKIANGKPLSFNPQLFAVTDTPVYQTSSCVVPNNPIPQLRHSSSSATTTAPEGNDRTPNLRPTRSQENKLVDANTSPDQIREYHMTRVFFPTHLQQATPQAEHMRINIYQDLIINPNPCDIDHAFELKKVGNPLINPPIHVIRHVQTDTLFAMAQDHRLEAGHAQFYAKKRFTLDGHWQAMPSMCAQEVITHTGTADIDIQYSSRDNLYYIRSNTRRTCDVEWLITVPTAPPPELPQDIVHVIERYQHFGKGALSISMPNPTGYDYLACLEDKDTGEKGACRHRSIAFKAFMKQHYPNVPVRVISNGCHMFVEVQFAEQWITCDLGGYPAKLTLDESNNPQPDHPVASVEQISAPERTATSAVEQDNSEPELIYSEISQAYQMNHEAVSSVLVDDHMQTDSEPEADSESQQVFAAVLDELAEEFATEAYYERRLQTWRQTTQPAESIAEYFEQLCVPGKNCLVELPSINNVNSLSLSLEQYCRDSGKPVYYIDSPDDLRCSSPYITVTGQTADGDLIGQMKRGPGGPLHEFLRTNRDTDPVLIVNYASFEADDIVRLNDLLNKTRRADSTLVPKKASVIGLLNINKPNCYRESDFYSRFHAITACPFSNQALGANIPPIVQNIEHTSEGASIDLFHSTDWETRLMGGWVLNQGQFHFEKGELVKALERGAQGITIQHGPWKDPRFVRFWQYLAVHKTLHYADQSIAIPADFTCYKPKHDAYDWPQLTRIASRVDPLASNASAHILNPSLLPQFFARSVCDNETESLQQLPGFIKAAKEQGTLDVQVTRALSDDQWAMLLAACEKEHVSLRIDCPRSVKLPWEEGVAQPMLLAELNEASIHTLTTAMIASTDMDSTVAVFQQSSAPWHVFDVSGYEASDLLTRIDPKFDKRLLRFKFKQKDAALLDLLSRGEHVILKGHFSPELQDHLSKLIKERWSQQASPGRLILIQDSKAPQTALQMLTHTVTVAKKLELLHLEEGQTRLTQTQLQKESLNRLKTRLIQKNPWQGMEGLDPNIRMQIPDLEHSLLIAERFDRERLKVVNRRLKRHPYVFLTGLTAVGKTTFVEKMFNGKQGKLYQGEKSLKRWARSKSRRRKILFIDEANFQEWDNFAGLLNTPPGIIIDGDYYPLTDQHKIIFAGNPVNYGDERKLPKLFHTYGNALTCDPMPPEYIYERILKPVLPEDIIDQAPIICAPWLAAYAFLCERSDQDVLISARELQMMAMLTMSYHALNPMVPLEQVACYYAHHVAKHLVPKRYQAPFNHQFPEPEPLPPLDLLAPAVPQTDFLITASRQPLITQLKDLLALRIYKRSEKATDDTQRYGGLGGIIIEGESGIGKSELVTALLKQSGYEETHYAAPLNCDCNRFYRLSVDMDMSQKIKLLHQAFHEGSVVIMDEINSSPMMERLLNSLLMGKTVKGERPMRPGFMIIGTQNPIKLQEQDHIRTLAGRRAPSNAIKRRLMTVTLPSYPRAEMIDIIAAKIGFKRASILVSAFEKNRAYALANHCKPIPTFRDVIKIAEEEAVIAQASSLEAEDIDLLPNDEGDETDVESVYSDASDEPFEDFEYSDDELVSHAQPTPQAFINQNRNSLPVEFSNNATIDHARHLERSERSPDSGTMPNTGDSPLRSERRVALAYNCSFYFLWMGAVVFAVIAAIVLCLALNVFFAPTFGLGPIGIAIASLLSVQTTPLNISLGYTATSMTSGLLSQCFFKAATQAVDLEFEQIYNQRI